MNKKIRYVVSFNNVCATYTHNGGLYDEHSVCRVYYHKISGLPLITPLLDGVDVNIGVPFEYTPDLMKALMDEVLMFVGDMEIRVLERMKANDKN